MSKKPGATPNTSDNKAAPAGAKPGMISKKNEPSLRRPEGKQEFPKANTGAQHSGDLAKSDKPPK